MTTHYATKYFPGLGTWGNTRPAYNSESCVCAVAPIAQRSGNKVLDYANDVLLDANVNWVDEYHRAALTADGIVHGIDGLFAIEGGSSTQGINCGEQKHDEFTFIMPFILKDWESFDYLVGNVSSAATEGWAVYTRNTANTITAFYGDGSTNLSGSISVDDGEWHLLVIRYKDSALSMRVDETDATDATGSAISYTNVDDMHIGSYRGSTFNGKFASGGFLLYDRYLEDEELPSLHEFFHWGFEHSGIQHLEITATGKTGTGSFEVGNPSLSGSGNQTYNSTGSFPVTELGLSGSGKQTYNSTGSIAISELELDGSGSVTLPKSGSGNIEPLSFDLAGFGKQTYNAAGSFEISTLEISGVGDLDTSDPISGSGSLSIDELDLAGAGKQTYKGSGSVPISNLTLSGIGKQTYIATGSLTIESLQFVGLGVIPVVEDSTVSNEVAFTLYAAIWEKLNVD